MNRKGDAVLEATPRIDRRIKDGEVHGPWTETGVEDRLNEAAAQCLSRAGKGRRGIEVVAQRPSDRGVVPAR